MKLLIILLLIIGLFLLIWLMRRKMDVFGQRFIDSVRQMEKNSGMEGRYQVPWLLLLGSDQKKNEALCQAWQLKSEDKPAWFGRFWSASDVVVLLPPHDIFSQSSGALAALSAWRRILAALLRVRGQRPLDALIWTISVERLLGADLTEEIALCKQFQIAQQRLGQTLPVYWLITGLEEIAGTRSLIESLPDEAQKEILGWSSAMGLSAAWQSDYLDAAILQVQSQLGDCICEMATLNGGISDELYLLPRQLNTLRQPLVTLAETAFQTNALGDAPVLRGLYLTAAYMPDVGESDLFAEAADLPQPLPVFSSRLLTQRIAAERGLAQPIVRIMTLRQRWHRIGRLAMGVFCSLWLLAMAWVWQSERHEAIELNRALSSLGQGNQARAESGGAGQSATALWQVLSSLQRLKFETPVFPTSLASSFDQTLDAKMASLLHSEWFSPAGQHLRTELESLQIEISDIEAEHGNDMSRPETWPRYMSAQQLVQRAGQLEQQVQLYNRALRGGGDALAQLSLLSGQLWGGDFRPERLPLRSGIESMLNQYAPWMGTPVLLHDTAKQTEARFKTLMQHWLEALFADVTFTKTADSVQIHLAELQSGNRNRQGDLETLYQQISLLKQLINASSSAWSGAKGQELVPGYRALLNQARSSSLIGKAAVAEVEASAASLRAAFQERWSDRESSLTARGEVGLREDVLQLMTAIHYLLEQDFVMAPHSVSGGGIAGSLKEMSEATLTAALPLYQSRQRYQAQSLGKVPDAYRKALSQFASEKTAMAMWHVLSGHAVDDLGQRNAVESLESVIRLVPDMNTALLDLGRHDLSLELNREVSERALGALRQADSALAEMAPFQPKQGTFSWWDGKKNASFKAFKVNNPLELQQYLVRQMEQLAVLALNQGVVLDWLNAHLKGLAAKDVQLVLRWRGIVADIKKAREKVPDSGPMMLAQLINKDLNEMDVSNCYQVLHQTELPAGQGLFAERAQRLVNLANERCLGLRAQNSAYAWQQLATYFNQYIAGRFPFAANTQASDADIERVTGLMRLIDTHLQSAKMGAEESESVNKEAALLFLQGLRHARELLGPLLVRGDAGQAQPLGVDIEVQWRSDRGSEQGADQVIEWRLAVGSQQARYPQGEAGKLRWVAGQPVVFGLRWAKDSAQWPLEDYSQPALVVFEKNAEWRYGGAWSLLRLLRNHHAPAGMVVQDEYAYPALLFTLPVSGQVKDKSRAQMFARFGISGAGGKAQLPAWLIDALPLKAPASPFRQITLPDIRRSDE